jgi:hypothetical protein
MAGVGNGDDRRRLAALGLNPQNAGVRLRLAPTGTTSAKEIQPMFDQY